MREIIVLPQPGDQVVATFRNGARIDGEVLIWTDAKSAIKSGTTITIIQKTLDDILFVRIIEAKIKQEQIKHKPIKSPDDIADLVELKKELLELEREELAAKLQNHEPSNPKPTQYGLHSELFKIKHPIQYSRTQTSREDTGFGAELQNMFGKEHSKD